MVAGGMKIVCKATSGFLLEHRLLKVNAIPIDKDNLLILEQAGRSYSGFVSACTSGPGFPHTIAKLRKMVASSNSVLQTTSIFETSLTNHLVNVSSLLRPIGLTYLDSWPRRHSSMVAPTFK